LALKTKNPTQQYTTIRPERIVAAGHGAAFSAADIHPRRLHAD
jgi:hypothetical protein